MNRYLDKAPGRAFVITKSRPAYQKWCTRNRPTNISAHHCVHVHSLHVLAGVSLRERDIIVKVCLDYDDVEIIRILEKIEMLQVLREKGQELP